MLPPMNRLIRIDGVPRVVGSMLVFSAIESIEPARELFQLFYQVSLL